MTVPKRLSMLALVSATFAMAASPVPVYSTGVGANGLTLAGGATDPHYSLIASPGAFPATVYTVLDSSAIFFAGGWLTNDPTGQAGSKWITPLGPTTPGDAGFQASTGNYTYRTTFDLAAFKPGTASLSVQWATDNLGVNVLLNGVSLNQTAGGWLGFSTFIISSGFNPGQNTLDFVVLNTGGPTGLRVLLNGTADPFPPASTSVPAAGTLSLVMTALGILLLAAHLFGSRVATSR
jgi:hypothetical protein